MGVFEIVIFVLIIFLSFLNLPVIHKNESSKLQPSEWINVSIFCISIIGLFGGFIF
jgi:hypothetical protein